MKIHLDRHLLGYHREANVWLGDLPDAGYPIERWSETEVEFCDKNFRQSRIAIELWMHTGPSTHYGLVGCRFESGEGGPAVAAAHSPPSFATPFPDNIGFKHDYIMLGLPSMFQEYGVDLRYPEAVLRGAIIGIGERGGMPKGVLRFCVAAHGDGNSSFFFFWMLAYTAIKLMDIETGASEAAIADCIKKCIKTAFQIWNASH